MEKSVEKETFLYNPDSLVALRYHVKPIKRFYHFEGIIAPKIGGTRSTNIYLTRTWVNNNFDKDFVQQVIEYGLKGNFLNMKNIEDNPTNEMYLCAEDFQDELKSTQTGAGKRLTKRYSGGDCIMLIAQLRLTGRFKNLATSAINLKWEITSISKDLYLNPKGVRKEVSEWLEIDEGLVMHEDCVGKEKCDVLLEELRQIRSDWLEVFDAAQIEDGDKFFEHTSSIKDFIAINPRYSNRLDLSKIKYDDSCMDLPHYIVGEKQISSIKYDKKRGFFMVKPSTPLERKDREILQWKRSFHQIG